MWQLTKILVAAGIASRFLDAGLANVLMAFAAVYAVLGLVNELIDKPLHPGLAIIGFVVCGLLVVGGVNLYISKRHPQLAKAKNDRETYLGFQAADKVDPKYPLALAEKIKNTEVSLLTAQQNEEIATLASLSAPSPKVEISITCWYKPWTYGRTKEIVDPNYEPMSYEAKEQAISDAKKRLAQIGARMQQVKLVMDVSSGNRTGEKGSATPSYSAKSGGGNAIVGSNGDEVFLTGAGASEFAPGTTPIKVHFDPGFYVEFEAVDAPIDIITQKGEKYTEKPGPEMVDLPGITREIKIKSQSDDKLGKLVITLIPKHG